jgi:cephalosporin-C deacetylase-like acetyl esterase
MLEQSTSSRKIAMKILAIAPIALSFAFSLLYAGTAQQPIESDKATDPAPRFHYPRVARDEITLTMPVGKKAETYVLSYKARPFSDLPLCFTNLPPELMGAMSIRVSYPEAQHDSMLQFEVNHPVRVYVGFAAGSRKGWLAPQPDWVPSKELTYATSDREGDLGEIRYRDFPAGRITLFPGRRGAYCLLGIRNYYKPPAPESEEELKKKQQVYNALYPAPWPLPPTAEMVHNYYVHLTQMHLAQGQDQLMAVETAQQWQLLRKDWGAALQRSMGSFPERTPLNARIVGRVDNPDAVIEKVIFESRPMFYVTGNLYLPRRLETRHAPAVLVVSGHYNEAKTDGPHRELCLRLARSGVVAFAIDCIGQGERSYYLDKQSHRMFSHTNPETKAPGYVNPCTEHSLLGIPCLLTGTNILQYFIWDNIRAIDYLEQRPEVDRKRIAVTGVSGGGTQTEFLAPVDSRVALAAPTCYVSDFLYQTRSSDAADEEQNPYGIFKAGLNHSSLIALAAPRPYQVQATLRDGNPIELVRQTVEDARHTYLVLGAGDRLQIAEDDAGHAYTEPLQKKFFEWLNKWLGGGRADAWDRPVRVNAPEELRCTTTGQVKTSFADARWVNDFNRERAKAVAPQRTMPTNMADLQIYQAAVRTAMQQALAINVPPMLPNHMQRLKREQEMITEVQWLGTEPGITVSAIFCYPNRLGRFPAVILISEHSNESGDDAELRRSLVKRSWAVASIEVRGVGRTGVDSAKERTEDQLDECNEEYLYIYSREMVLTHNALTNGTSLFAGRLLDVLQSFNYFVGRPEVDPRRIAVVGRGEGGVLALSAAAKELRIAGCVVLGAPLSYRMLVETDRYAVPPAMIVFDVLSHYDLPEAAACVAPRPLRLSGGVDAMMKRVSREVATGVYRPAVAAYAAARAGNSLVITEKEENWVEWIGETMRTHQLKER